MIHEILHIPGESEIWYKHPILEDWWCINGSQSGQACLAEKCPDRRLVTYYKLFFPFSNHWKINIPVLIIFFILFCSCHYFLLTGVAYTSECFPCNPGTFSRVPGSSTCEPCPRDTFSSHGASSCTPCNTTTHYAGRNAHTCHFQIYIKSLEQHNNAALQCSLIVISTAHGRTQRMERQLVLFLATLVDFFKL